MNIQQKKQNITPLPNNRGHRTFKYSTHQGNCYTRLNHSGNCSGYYTKTPKAGKMHSHTPYAEDKSFYKCISKCLSNGKAPKQEANLFTHIKGLLYKHVMDTNQKFMALIIPKAWKYTVLVDAHDKRGHQGGTCTYCLIKCQYYWKGMNKDI